MSQTIVGINDLPDEVLTQIFDRSDIPIGTLLNLALSSKRLHYFCLPLYFARFEILDPLEFCEFVLSSPQETPGSLDALTGLKTALFIPSVKHLVCRLRLPGDIEDFLYAATHMRRLYEFISTLSSIDTVTLQFITRRCGCCSELDPGQTLDGHLLEWSDALGLALNTIIEKSCRNLVISGGRFMVHSYLLKAGLKTTKQQSLITPFRRLFRKNKFSRLRLSPAHNWINVLQGDTWKYMRAPETGKTVVLTPITHTAESASSLKTLTIQSMMLAIPPLLHWTISVLRLPTTEFLALKNLTIPRKEWLVFLSLIAEHSPHLTKIRLSRLRHLNAVDVLHFVGLFPNLESLNIALSVDSYDAPNLGPFPRFAHLKHLTAPASWISKLLSSQRDVIPNLQTISIAYNLRNNNLFDWTETPSRPTSIPTMLKALSRPSLAVFLRIFLGRNPGWALLEDSNRFNANDPPDQLDSVIGLTLFIEQRLVPNEMALSTILPQWIKRFSKLRHLGLKSTVNPMNDNEVAELAGHIMRRSRLPHLKTFEVNGQDIMPQSR